MSLSKYFKPTSLTWWASFVPLLAGVIVATGPIHGLSAIVDTINNFTGHVMPAFLINAGLVGIGLRGAVKE